LLPALVRHIALALSFMIALVTGSSGFIGSHLVDALLARGATVRVLVRAGAAAGPPDPRVTRFTVDLLDDRSVRESPAWADVTHVFHLAGVTKRRTLAQFRSGNVVPTANLLAAAVARGGSQTPRFVFVSTQAAGGPASSPDRPVREDDPPLPIEGYGQSKLEAEAAARRYEGQLPVTIVRPAAVYGPRDRDFLRAFRLAARSIAIHAVPRENLFSIVHVADLVDALLRAGDRPQAVGRTYCIANDAPVTWRQLYAEIAAAASRGPKFDVQLPMSAVSAAGYAGDIVSALTGWHTLANRHKTRLARPRWWLCDPSRAHAELDWISRVPLQQGVRETYLWYLAARWMRPRKQGRAPAPTEESQV
jgi:nucleoside-diphosphate-sugar epimerase